jgi:septum formation protein
MAASSLWLAGTPLVLASKSKARRKLLEDAGIVIEARPADIDERALEAKSGTQDAAKIASLLAAEKAKSIARQMPGRLVLGADQTLAAGTKRFSQPADRDAAAEQLEALSGKTHLLHSAIAVACDDTVLFAHGDTARMTMRALSAPMIAAYLDVAGEAATSSVGAYQVEGPGIQLFDTIDGDYFTILGLPLLPLLAFLRREKLIVP